MLEINKDIILTDINLNKIQKLKKKLEKTFKSSQIFSIKMDVTNEKSINKVWSTFNKKKIIIDVLINNAALDPKFNKKVINGKNSRLEFFSVQNWHKEFSVGLTGTILCSKIFGTQLIKKRTKGIILNIASDLSVISPNQNVYKISKIKKSLQPVKPIGYSIIKHGIVGLTKYISTYWSSDNIRCNALSPGPVLNLQSKALIKNLEKLIPMGRLANKNEYKSAIKFLCTEDSSYMTGQNVIIDGGRSIW